MGEIRNGFENMFGAINNTSEDYQLPRDPQVKLETHKVKTEKKAKRSASESADKPAEHSTMIINATFGGEKKFLPTQQKSNKKSTATRFNFVGDYEDHSVKRKMEKPKRNYMHIRGLK